MICCAEDLNIPIFYQDTDSIHIHQSNLCLLANEFMKRYNRELIGKQLGQFHSDFNSFGSTDEMPVAVRSVFVMKKGYIDQLKNSTEEIAFHIRLKGIPSDLVVKKANELFPNDIQCFYEDGLAYPMSSVSDNNEYSVFHLYKHIYNNEMIEFDLCESIKPSFELKDMKVSTRDHFIRQIQI